MQRRELIAGLVKSTIAAVPVFGLRLASAQQAQKVRRLGVLMGGVPESGLLTPFVEELARLGWTDGRNGADSSSGGQRRMLDRASAFATELVAAQPDIIFCSTTMVTAALHRETSTIPIVFALVGDPVGAGFVAGLPRPGGNITGFTNNEAAMGGKWLSLLKEVAPSIKRAGFMFNPETAPDGGKYFLASFEAAAGSATKSSRSPCLYAAMPKLRPRLPLLEPSKRASSSSAPSGRPCGNDPFLDNSPQGAGDVRGGHVCQRRRPNRIWGELDGHVPPRGRLCRSHPARRETGRPAGADADEIRDDDQPENGQGARPHRAAQLTRARRRGDRIGERDSRLGQSLPA